MPQLHARPKTLAPGRFSGAMGWISWAAATLFVFYQLVVQNSYAALDGTLRQSLEMDVTSGSIASAVFLVVYGLMQVPAGLIIDRLGPGRVLAPAALLLAAFTWGFSFAEGFWSATLLRAAMGFAASFAFPGAGLIARRRLPLAVFPLAMGLIDCIFGLGLWVGDAGVATMLTGMHWRSVMAMLALGGVVIALLCLVCIPPIGPSNRPPDGSVGGDLRRLLGDPHVVRTAIVYAMVCGITFGFAGLWNIPLQEAWGFTRHEAVMFNSWIFIGMAIGAPCMGALGMRVHWRRPLLVGGIALALMCVLTLLFAPGPDSILFIDAIHVALGVAISASILCFPIGCRDVVPARVATAIGVINAAGLLAAGCFQLLPGIALGTLGEPDLPLLQIVLSVFAAGLVVALPLAWSLTREVR